MINPLDAGFQSANRSVAPSKRVEKRQFRQQPDWLWHQPYRK
jgi:hypothetical protein